MRDVTPNDHPRRRAAAPPARRAPPTHTEVVAELEAGLDDGQQIEWSEEVPLDDGPEIQRATAGDVFDGASWLRELRAPMPPARTWRRCSKAESRGRSEREPGIPARSPESEGIVG